MNTYIILFSRSARSEDALAFAALVQRQLPNTRPEKFYLYENKKQMYRRDRLKAFARLWSSDGVWWVRRSAHVYGWCSPGDAREHTLVLHTFDTKSADDSEIVQFLIDASSILQADYALAHAIPKKQVLAEDEDVCSVVPRLLPLGLPGVPWLALYGPPYVDVVGKAKLLAAPAYSVQDVGRGSVTCQVTEKLSDLWNNRAAFEPSRDRIAAHMGPVFYKSFRIQGIDPKRAKKRPAFVYPIVERPEDDD